MERLFGALPTGLHLQAEQCAYDLALRTSRSGDLRDAFLGLTELPLLSLGPWLVADLEAAPTARNEETEAPADGALDSLLLVALVGALRVQVRSSITEPLAFSDASRLAIFQYLTVEELIQLELLFPSDHRFWPHYRELLATELERSAVAQGAAHPGSAVSALDLLQSRWSLPAATVALAALELTGADDRVRQAVLGMVDDMALAFETWQQLASVPRDLREGHLTYPIVVAADAADIPLDLPAMSTALLGALAASDALRIVIDTATKHLLAARQAADELGLVTIGPYLEAVGEAADARNAPLLGTGVSRPGAVAAILLSTDEPSRGKALAMAEGYLLADRTFRESWETHREGLLGGPEVSARFPAGLVLEILTRHGYDVDSDVDAFIAASAADGFRYYAHPRSPADADTLGVVLRLARAGLSSGADAALGAALDCLDRIVADSRAMPVWLPDCTPSLKADEPTINLGEGCATVVGHLLLGLCLFAPAERRETIEIGAGEWLARLEDVGLGANLNYPPFFALSVYFRLLKTLESLPYSVGTAGAFERVQETLEADLLGRSSRPLTGALEAALAISACRAAGRSDLIQNEWTTIILRQQRFDGGWPAEPFAMAPNRGRRVSAYSSAVLTTAMCFDALIEPAGP